MIIKVTYTESILVFDTANDEEIEDLIAGKVLYLRQEGALLRDAEYTWERERS